MRQRNHALGLVAAGVVVLVLGACSTDSQTEASSTTAAAPATTQTGTGAEATHNQADVMFARMMIPHHQQAIEMSDMLLGKQGIDPQIRELATAIKNAQGPEIEQMQSWLQEWGMPGMPGGGMPGHDMPGHTMPGGDMDEMPGMAGHGMMSAADMTALENAQGDEAGRLFLSQMIEHHEGAITMAQQEIDTGQFPATVELARSIVTTQQEEIVTMKGLLEK